MLHAKRSLVIKVASAVSALAMIAAVTAVAISRSPHTVAASSAFHATKVHLTAKSVTQSKHLLGSGGTTQAATRANTTATKTLSRKEFHVSKQAAPKTNAAAPRVNAPSVRLGPQIAPKIGSATNFDGLSELDNDFLNGFEVTPPDQGLCAAPDPYLGINVVLEMTNMAIAEYDTNGNLISENSLTGMFGTPYAYGDPRCVYDAQAHAIYFTELDLEGFFDSSNAFGADLVAIDTTNGNRSEYYIDWSDNANSGCPCLGDQMRIGYDNSGIYLTADEFPLYGPGTFNEGYNGSEMFVLDKADVLNNTLSNAWYYNNLTVSGIPVLGLMPAQSQTFAGSEWLANTFPYTADGNNNSVSHSVALWRAVGDSDLETTAPTISVSVASTEQYAYPVTAVSTTGADGSTSIDAGDDRIGQLEFNNNHLYTTATSAVNVSGDPNTYDGAVWFDFNTVTRSVSHQGYIAFKGDYLVYPSIIRTHGGAAYVVYTITNHALNPSAAFSNRPTDTYPFNSPQMSAYGISPHFSYAYRWGDYSAACIDTNGHNVWMATEYIPPLANQGFYDNWGTRVTSR